MAEPITPDLVHRLTTVSDPALSPDGARVAFVRSRVHAESVESRSLVVMAELPGGEAIEFTAGTRDTKPRFSPDGASLAFLRPDDKGRAQVWSMATAGGEARQLSHAAGAVSEIAWSPDSMAIAAVVSIDPDLAPDDHDAKKDPRVKVVRRIRYRYDTLGWLGDAHRHVFVLDIASGEMRQVTDGDWDDGGLAWSPDGSAIAFVSDRSDDRDLFAQSQAYVVPAAGGAPEERSQGLNSVVSLAWAPDGRRLVVLGSDDPDVGGSWHGRLYVLEPGRDPRPLTDGSISVVGGFPGLQPSPEIRWTEDGRIVFLADRHGETSIYQVDVESGDMRVIGGGGAKISGLSLDRGAAQAAAVVERPDSAGDICLFDAMDGSMRQITAFNAGYFRAHPPGRMEKFTLTRAGEEIESRVVLPPGFDPSRRYPLVLDIHGGPHGVFYDAFSPTQQVLATAGYVVLAVNPRGSSSYGVDFMKAVLGDWGGEDCLDIMAAVDEMCSRPYIDASRMGITGYSYGGFMSSWIIGHDTRFKAAVVGAPCINLSSMYGTSDIGVSFGEVQWGGVRKDTVEEFRAHSPLTFAPNMETPVLLLHGESDHRCPISQSEEYFVTLKRLGKEVEFVRFPDSAHSFLRAGHPRLRESYLTRMLAWMDQHIVAESAASVEAQPTTADG